MKSVWCWRCKTTVPMLDEREYESISNGIRSQALSVKHRLRTENRPMKRSDEADLYRGVATRYGEITGITDVNPREILRHRLSLVGPPCENCGKELRTPRARKCLECGHLRSSPVVSGPS
jgi:hypothetical protein